MLPPTRTANTPAVAPVPALSYIKATAPPFLIKEVVETQQEDPTITKDALRWGELQNSYRSTPEEEIFFHRNRLTEEGFWQQDEIDGQ